MRIEHKTTPPERKIVGYRSDYGFWLLSSQPGGDVYVSASGSHFKSTLTRKELRDDPAQFTPIYEGDSVTLTF